MQDVRFFVTQLKVNFWYSSVLLSKVPSILGFVSTSFEYIFLSIYIFDSTIFTKLDFGLDFFWVDLTHE